MKRQREIAQRKIILNGSMSLWHSIKNRKMYYKIFITYHSIIILFVVIEREAIIVLSLFDYKRSVVITTDFQYHSSHQCNLS